PDPNEPGGALVLFGRLLDGSWGYWFATQQGIYQRLALPGGMLVCADGNGARLRAAPDTDAEIVDVLPDLTLMTGDRFVLTQPGDIATHTVGAGWYHLSAPESGWIASTLTTDAGRGDCSLRDIMTAGR
ncbi:MAG: SH3 domain-containing protein, partial [Dehalococcoidia bacterium]